MHFGHLGVKSDLLVPPSPLSAHHFSPESPNSAAEVCPFSAKVPVVPQHKACPLPPPPLTPTTPLQRKKKRRKKSLTAVPALLSS